MLRWIVLPIKRMTDYRGRSRRREFWLFTLAMLVTMIMLYLLADALFPVAEGAQIDPVSDEEAGKAASLSPDGMRFFNMLARPFLLFFAVVHLPLAIRRLHDTGRSWWAYLVSFLPYIGPLILLWLLAKDGDPYGNQWGPDPKKRDEINVFEGEVTQQVPLPAAQVRKR